MDAKKVKHALKKVEALMDVKMVSLSRAIIRRDWAEAAEIEKTLYGLRIAYDIFKKASEV